MSGASINFGSGSTGTSALSGSSGGNSLDPVYYGQQVAKIYSDAQAGLPAALASYQNEDGTISSDLDPELVQAAMRYVMNMPLESQYYEMGLDKTDGTYKSVKPMSYSSRDQMDFVDQHESDKEAYNTLIKDAKKRSSSSSSSGTGTSVLSGDTSLTSLYQTLLGGGS